MLKIVEEWFRCPDISRELVPPLRCQNKKSRDFAEWALFAPSGGGTSRPADVVEGSARAGACGLITV